MGRVAHLTTKAARTGFILVMKEDAQTDRSSRQSSLHITTDAELNVLLQSDCAYDVLCAKQPHLLRLRYVRYNAMILEQ